MILGLPPSPGIMPCWPRPWIIELGTLRIAINWHSPGSTSKCLLLVRVYVIKSNEAGYIIILKISRNRCTQCNLHNINCKNGTIPMKKFYSCTCGKCSLVALFRHICPRAYDAFVPYLQNTTLMSYYSSDFLLPADNWWNILSNLALLTLGGIGLPLLSQDSSTCDRKQCFRLMGAQPSTYLQDDHCNIKSENETLKVFNSSAKQRWLFQNYQTRLLNSSSGHPLLEWNTNDSTTDPADLANLTLLLLSIAGDIELNPGPESENFQRIIKQLSDKVEAEGLHTQKTMIVSVHASLFSEAKITTKGKTLQGLYERLSSSRKYCDFSDRILYYIIVRLLSLSINDDEQQILKECADLQSEHILESKEIKFLELINFLSYESKEDLISANILPGSGRNSTEDAAEMIGNLILRGHLAPTSTSLVKFLKSDSYKVKIKEVMDAPELTDPDGAATKMTSSKFDDPVELDSPQLLQKSLSKSLGVVEVLSKRSGWTAPVIKEFDTPGEEHISSPTIRELAVFPTLGDAWKNLGTALSIDDQTLQLINRNFPSLIKKQRELFRAYLNANPSPTWRDIIDALVKIGKQDIARKVIDTFDLSQELLAMAAQKSIGTGSLLTSRVESDIGHLVPARLSKTEVLSSTLVSPLGSGKPQAKPHAKRQIVSDDGAALSAEATVDIATPTTSTRLSKTERFSPKNVGHPHFDSSIPPPKSRARIVSDDGKSSPAKDTDNQFQMVSMSLPPYERKFETTQMPVGSDSIDGGQVHSSISISDGELIISEDRQLSEDNSLSSGDFHSAEEAPLESTYEKRTERQHQIAPQSHLSHQGVKRLHEAILSKNTEGIDRCISENTAILNATLEVDSGQTALHIAARLGFKDITKLLLQRKASVTVQDSNGCTPLYLAASCGNYEIAKMIIASPDCNVNTANKDGTPLLLDPASKGFSMICELLLENRANPLTETRTGVSPLYVASRNGHKDVVKILLKFEADVTRVCTETSKTPLQEAIDNEHIEVTKLLMNALSEINKKNERLFECKTAERVHELTKHGANVDARKANGSTPLIAHSAAGNKEVVQALIEQKANVDIQDNDGWSALMIASQSGHIEIVRSLIYAGAIPDLKNKEGLTALMCATLAAHMNVIKELLLAKADPLLKRRDGRSALEIAEQYGNQEIITALKRHTTTASPGNDPLYSLLGSYLELKKANASEKQATKNGEKASHDHMTLTVKKRESLSSLLPKPPSSTANDTSTAKQELEKCYKRIADLETRIHDLTLQNSVEVPVETDLAYLERRRLEDEYSKLKELKRKAEQYAVEAKQTAQRLSAENSKLREDLSKERHHNEITRNNIIREFEQKSGHDTSTMGGEKLAAKMEVFDQEIQDRAYQLLRRMPQEKGSIKRVELKAMEIKEVVLEKRISINCLGLAVMGLPSSGKTELLHQMLELKVEASLSAQGSSALDIHEAVLCHNQFNDSHTLIKSREDCSVQPISVALAKTLVCMHKVPSLSTSMSSLVDPNNLLDEFPDLDVNRHFKAVLENVQKVALQLESRGSLGMLMTGSLSIFTLANTKVGKVAYEIFCALASCCENFVILNLLNLERDSSETLTSPADSEQSGTSIKYTMTKPESALVRYMDAAHIASRNCKGKRVIMVGTHKDKLNQGKLKETKKNLEKITMGYAESIGVAGAICPGMECINARDIDDCQRLQKRIIELIKILEKIQYNIPIRYLFLLSYLQNLNQMFISRKKLVDIARTCGVMDEDEIEEFLIIFNSCGSLIYSNDDEIPTLKDFIILNPFNFIKELDKLNQITTMSFSDKLELFEEVNDTRLGFISEKMARYLWPGEGDGRMTQAHFFLTFLKELKVILPCTALQLETDMRKGKFYYMPILRADHDSAELKGDSSSLIIVHNNAVVPFRLQTDVIFQIQNHFGTTVTFDPKPHYNTICFKWHESSRDQCNANIIIRFNTEHIEVSVLFPNRVPHLSTVTRICSQLKTACVQIFQVLSTEIKRLNYEFAFVCPHSSDTPSQSHADMYSTHVHFIRFHPLRAGEKNFFCQSCQKRIPSDNLPWAKLLWTQVAYQGPIRDEGCLTNEHIVMLCQSLVSRLDLHTINHFAKQLKFSKEEAIPSHPLMPLESLLHFLIFTWRSRHPVNSIESLAKILHSCGCYQEAIQLDPLLLQDSMKSIQGHEISLSLTDFEWSSIAAYLPQSTMKLLVSSTDPKSKATGSPDGTSSRETVIHKLRELEYHSLAVALEIGWFL